MEEDESVIPLKWGYSARKGKTPAAGLLNPYSPDRATPAITKRRLPRRPLYLVHFPFLLVATPLWMTPIDRPSYFRPFHPPKFPSFSVLNVTQNSSYERRVHLFNLKLKF